MATSGSPTLSLLDMEREIVGSGPSRPHNISRSNKAAAAVSSAAVTSLLMTPFDVIKTRMQTQPAADPLFQPSLSTRASAAACCQSTTVASQPDLACRFDPRQDGKTAGTSSLVRDASHSPRGNTGAGRSRTVANSARTLKYMSDAACIYPDRKSAARELKEIQNQGRLSGLWDGVIKVGRSEGVRGLWRGLTPTLIMTVPSQLTYMTCYDTFRTAILAMGPETTLSTAPSLSNISSHHLIASMLSGAGARSVSATLVTPIELVRTRLQASTTSRNLSAIFGDLSREVQREGPRVLFRGLVPTLYRDVPFSAIYFTGYESMKRVLTGTGFGERIVATASANDGTAPARRGLNVRDFTIAFASGATSGTVAALCTQPFDLIKTRLQAVEQRPGGGALTANTTMQAWRDIVAREGAKGLFRGLSPRVAKVAPACGVMISSFELVARWLDERW